MQKAPIPSSSLVPSSRQGSTRRNLTPKLGHSLGSTWLKQVLWGLMTFQTPFGVAPRRLVLKFNYTIMDKPSPYNMILGRPTLYAFLAIVFTLHHVQKFREG